METMIIPALKNYVIGMNFYIKLNNESS